LAEASVYVFGRSICLHVCKDKFVNFVQSCKRNYDV
jgi:hypothetical protein